MGIYVRPFNRAVIFAVKAHANQRRKYTGEPYVVHCIEVMEIIDDFSFKLEMQMAAVLHDTLEDTSVIYEDLKKEFGSTVADLVLELTDVSCPDDGNRAKRKEIDRLHLLSGSMSCKIIKLADILSNTSSIVRYDKIFARVYLDEIKLLLDSLVAESVNLDNSYEKEKYIYLLEHTCKIVEAYQREV